MKYFYFFLILIFLAEPVYAAVEISDGSVKALYHLEGVNDSSGNGLNFTNQGSSFVAGKLGNAVQTTGPATNYLWRNTAVLTSTANFTLHGWVNISSISESGIYFGTGNDGTNGYHIGVGNGNYNNAGNIISLAVDGVVNENTGVSYGTGWHMIDWVNRNGDNYIYLDGTAVYGFTRTPNAPSGNTTIGVECTGVLCTGPESGATGANALTDEVAFIDKAIPTSTITELWNGGSGAEICVTVGCGGGVTTSTPAYLLPLTPLSMVLIVTASAVLFIFFLELPKLIEGPLKKTSLYRVGKFLKRF